MLVSTPGCRLEHLGAQLAQDPQQLAVLDQLGLAAQARLDVPLDPPLGPAAAAVGDARQQLDDVVTDRSRSFRRRRQLGRSKSSDGMGVLAFARLLLAPQREEPLPQLAPGPVQPDLGRRLADAQLGGDGSWGRS